jgi:integrase
MRAVMNCSTEILSVWFARGAKRRTAPSVLTPLEIKALINNLSLRERTLVLVVASTGLRQSELFGLKWGDINFDQGTMSVTRSIVCGVVGPCKTESSRKPVPVHPTVLEALAKWKEASQYIGPDDWVFASRRHRGRKRYGARRSYASTFVQLRSASGFRNGLDGIRSGTHSRLCCEASVQSSR